MAEERFERELATDQRLRQIFNWGTLSVSLFAVITLLVLIMPLQRTSPWLIAFSLYSIATRLSVLVARSALLYPRFLLDLDSGDAARAGAALSVFERHRATILPPVLASLRVAADRAAVAAFPWQEAARLARAHGIERRRRAGFACFAAWCIVSAFVWTTLVVTRGGPTG